MFKYFLIAALVACVYANADESTADIKSLESDVRADGFSYILQTTNDIESKASGDEHGNIQGNFGWISPEGEHIQISYIADEHGYQPSGAVLPTAHPIPEYVLKTIAYNAAHPVKEEYHH